MLASKDRSENSGRHSTPPELRCRIRAGTSLRCGGNNQQKLPGIRTGAWRIEPYRARLRRIRYGELQIAQSSLACICFGTSAVEKLRDAPKCWALFLVTEALKIQLRLYWDSRIRYSMLNR